MLRPDSRVVLLDQLRPPAGYKLKAAIATTFTLQLGAALIPPLAFATHGIIAQGDPLAVLESVRSASNRIDIYCQAGQIVVPKRASDLMAFLEPMLHPVRPPRNGYLFHPKVWFVHYTANDGPDRYRFLCLTRNLVHSQAWDAAVVLDGADSGKVLEVNRPLEAFLRFLPEIAVNPSEERAQRARALADRAARVQWIHPNGVTGLRFHALGVPGAENTVDYSGLRHLVISPFCDTSGLDHVTDGNRRAIVVSRGEALDALEPASLSRYRLGTDEGSVFVLDALADPPPERTEAEADDTVDAGREPTQYSAFRMGELTGLHAKVTVIEKNRKAHVIIGSANATSAAFGGNVEFVVEMWGRTQDLGFRTLMDRGPQKGQRNFRDLLQPYVAEGSAIEPVDEELRRLRNLLRRLAAVPLQISVKSGPANYVLLLSSDEAMSLPEDHEMRFELLTRPGVSRLQVPGAAVEAGFDGVPLEDITPFVVLKLRGPDGTVVDTVIHAPLVNDPQDRLDAVLARQINSREKFLRFLALVLGLADPTAAWELTGGSSSADGPWGSGSAYPGVFEMVITAMADRPKAIVELDRLVTRMRQTDQGRQLLPEGFEELWANVQLALAQMRKRP